MEFRIVYNKIYNNIVLSLEKQFKLKKEIVNTLNLFEIFFENEVIYSNKDNFNNMEIDDILISDKIKLYIDSKLKDKTKSDTNLDNIDLDEY